jgi:tetratricopeptide (TPR) repeat protein
MQIKHVSVVLLLIAVTSMLMAGCRTPEADVTAPTVAAFPLKVYLEKSAEAYAARADLAKAREAFNLMTQAQKANPGDYTAAWTMAKYAYYLADHTPDKGDAKPIFNQGIKAGREAIALDANKPEGLFWLGANLGGRAQLSPLDGASDAEEIRELMKKVIKIDPKFQSGSAYLGLGQVDLKLPKMLGGDPGRAVTTLESGLQYGNDNSLYHLRLAEAYVEVDRKDDARKQIELIKTMTPNPDFLPEHADALRMANELAASL